MARKITIKPKKPMMIEKSDKPIFICACGLSKNKPFCDGAHTITQDEEEGKVYEYNKDGSRKEIKN
jgi:CDGSH iron-sulfur domain-containing protein 3